MKSPSMHPLLANDEERRQMLPTPTEHVPSAVNFVPTRSWMVRKRAEFHKKGDKAAWYRGKSLDTFGPIGPVVVTPEDIGDAQDLNIVCRLNGQVVQSSNPGKRELSRDKYLETDCFLTKKQENNL